LQLEDWLESHLQRSNYLITKQRVIIVVITIISLVAILGNMWVVPSNDSTIFFEEDAIELQNLRKLSKMYGSSDNIIITLSSSNKSIITKENISIFKQLVAQFSKVPYIQSVNSIVNEKRTIIGPFGPKSVTLFSDRRVQSSRAFSSDSLWVISSKLNVNYLVGMTGDIVGFDLRFNLQDIESGDDNMIIDSIESILDNTLKNSELVPFVTGGLYINRAFTDAGLRDSRLLTPIMLIVIMLLALIFLKSIREVGVLAITILPIPMIVMGITGWLRIPFTSTTAVVPIIVLAISLATSIHLISAFNRAVVEDDLEPVSSALQESRRGILFTSITTIIGFLALNFSKIPPFRTMGNLAALGTLLAAIFTLTTLPILLDRFCKDRKVRASIFDGEFIYKMVEKKYKLLIIIVLVLLGLSSSGLFRLVANDSFIEYFSEDIKFRRDTDSTLKYLTGIDYLQISLPTDTKLYDSSYLSKVESVTRFCEADSSVRYVISLPKIVEDSWPFKKIREGFSYNRKVVDKLKSENASPRIISESGSSSQVLVIFNKVQSKELREFASRCRSFTDSLRFKDEVIIASSSLLFANLSQDNSRSMNRGVLISLLLISLSMLIITKSSRLTLISIIPNALPILISFGFWGIIFGKSGLGLSVVAPIVLGIIVDDTVHSLTHYSKLRGLGISVKEAIRECYRVLSTPITITSIILIVAFGSLTLSSFQPTREMGIIAASTIFLALLGDLILLPSLLLLFDKD
jgi:predicted RND superfamily exporter protein